MSPTIVMPPSERNLLVARLNREVSRLKEELKLEAMKNVRLACKCCAQEEELVALRDENMRLRRQPAK